MFFVVILLYAVIIGFFVFVCAKPSAEISHDPNLKTITIVITHKPLLWFANVRSRTYVVRMIDVVEVVTKPVSFGRTRWFENRIVYKDNGSNREIALPGSVFEDRVQCERNELESYIGSPCEKQIMTITRGYKPSLFWLLLTVIFLILSLAGISLLPEGHNPPRPLILNGW